MHLSLPLSRSTFKCINAHKRRCPVWASYRHHLVNPRSHQHAYAGNRPANQYGSSSRACGHILRQAKEMPLPLVEPTTNATSRPKAKRGPRSRVSGGLFLSVKGVGIAMPTELSAAISSRPSRCFVAADHFMPYLTLASAVQASFGAPAMMSQRALAAL